MSINWLSLFIFYIIFPFSYQFRSSSPVVQSGSIKAPFFHLAPLPCACNSSGPSMSSSHYSPSPHHPSLPLSPRAFFPSTPMLGTPQHVPSLPLPVPLLAMAMSPTGSQQQGSPFISQANLGSFHTTQPLTLSQVQSTPYPAHPAPHPEQELAEQPVQVNMWLSSNCNG